LKTVIETKLREFVGDDLAVEEVSAVKTVYVDNNATTMVAP